jgi:hypothetical protein
LIKDVDAVVADRLVCILDHTFEAVAYRKQHWLSSCIWLSHERSDIEQAMAV